MVLSVLYIHTYYVSDGILLFVRNTWQLIASSSYFSFRHSAGPIDENAQVELPQMINWMVVLETDILSTNFSSVVTHKIFIGKSTDQLF